MRTARKLALSVCVFALAATALEVGLRLAGYERRPAPPIVIWNPVEDQAIQSGKSVFQADGACLWTPRPGAAIRSPLGGPGADEFVNAAGFRGPELARERVPGRLRIATLGDSSTFGLGVAWEDTYSARLVALLAEEGIEAEVLNGGVVGYTARQGLERYRRAVRPYRPDVVIAAFGAINDGIADRLNDADKLARQQQGSCAMTWLRERSRTVQLASSLGSAGRVPAHSQRGPTDPPTSRTMPQGMVPRLSLEAFDAALSELDELVCEDGARFIAISMPRKRDTEQERPHLPDYSKVVMTLASSRDWLVVDAMRLFRGHPERRTLLLDPFHPTARGHELIAEALTRAVLDDRSGER